MEYLVYWAFSGVVICTIGELVNSYQQRATNSDHIDWTEVLVLGTVFGPLLAPFFVWALWDGK